MLDKESFHIIIAIILSYLFEQLSFSFNIPILHLFLFINILGLYYLLKHISVSVQIKYNV